MIIRWSELKKDIENKRITCNAPRSSGKNLMCHLRDRKNSTSDFDGTLKRDTNWFFGNSQTKLLTGEP